MATKDEVLSAVAIVREFAGNPDVGVVKDLLDSLADSVNKPVTTKTSTVITPVDKEAN